MASSRLYKIAHPGHDGGYNGTPRPLLIDDAALNEKPPQINSCEKLDHKNGPLNNLEHTPWRSFVIVRGFKISKINMSEKDTSK